MVRVVLANFIVVPIIGVFVVRVFALDDLIAVGILLMAIAPGVPFLPLLAGDEKWRRRGTCDRARGAFARASRS